MRPKTSNPVREATPPPWSIPAGEVLRDVGSSAGGLTAGVAQTRLTARRATRRRHHEAGWVRLLVKQFTSPITLVLVAATVVSMAVSDLTDGVIIIAIILASGLLGFAQDFRAGKDVAALLTRVQVNATVIRSGTSRQVAIADVVRGDVVVLSAGSVIPADCRLLRCNELSVDESVLTGESFPVEKDAAAVLAAGTPIADRTTMVFFGTHVASGRAEAVVVALGDDTELGRVSADLRAREPVTAYEQGISQFGFLLVRLMLVLTGFIFAVNTASGRPVLEALLFSLALAVGLTPQMLPAIVTISLSSGARLMPASWSSSNASKPSRTSAR